MDKKMNKMGFEEFQSFYNEKGYLPYNMYVSPNGLNNKQLKTKYQSYCKKVDGFNSTPDEKKKEFIEKWNMVKEFVYKRDHHQCRLWKVLTLEERKEVLKNGYGGKFKEITPAHFIRRSKNKDLILDPDNIYTLSLMFHSHLDDFKNPLNGEPISKERVVEFWRRIIDNEQTLQRLLKEG